MADIQYNRIIRKYVLGFGSLFDKITVVRYNLDQTEQERFIIPIAYAPKELYVMRLQGDPDLDKKIQMALPRFSFEMTGLTYDSTRKQNTNWKTFVNTASGVKSIYNPVPYNFDFSLYLYVRNIEDGTQVMEQILPYFTPDYTIKLNLIPEMGIIKEVPIVLNSTSYDIDYEGTRERDTRIVIWTLNFTVKGFIFGKTSDTGLIKTSITNVLNNINSGTQVIFDMANTGNGIYQTGEIAYQGFSLGNATASGKVVSWSNTTSELTMTDINGNFVSSTPVIGSLSNAQYNFVSYKVAPVNFATITVRPDPSTANVDDYYSYNVSIYEVANSGISYG